MTTLALVLLAGTLYQLGWWRGWRDADPYGIRRDEDVNDD